MWCCLGYQLGDWYLVLIGALWVSKCCPKLMLCIGAMPSGLAFPLEQIMGVHLSHQLR